MKDKNKINGVERESAPRYSIGERLHGWRLGISVDGESIAKGAVCAALVVLFSLLQTTMFTRFRPFGVVPDLILPLVVAVSMTEHERWGAVFGVCAAFVIESLGGSTLTLLPILYMPCGYICGILTVHYFRDSFAVRALYTVVTSLLRAVLTCIVALSTLGNVSFITLFTEAVLPELLANIAFAALPHVAAKLCLRPFNRTRDERTK